MYMYTFVFKYGSVPNSWHLSTSKKTLIRVMKSVDMLGTAASRKCRYKNRLYI